MNIFKKIVLKYFSLRLTKIVEHIFFALDKITLVSHLQSLESEVCWASKLAIVTNKVENTIHKVDQGLKGKIASKIQFRPS